MQATITWDTTNIRAAMKTLRRNAPAATADGVRVMGAAVLGRSAKDAISREYDTGRYARGWVKAHNDLAGPVGTTGSIPRLPLPPLRVSKYTEKLGTVLFIRKARLEKAWRYRQRIIMQMQSDGRTNWKKYRETKIELDRLDRVLAEVRKQVAILGAGWKQPGTIVMLGKRTQTRFRISNIERVFVGEYGATATLEVFPDGAIVNVRHMEPNAPAVEKRSRIFATAMADLNYETGGMTRRLSKAFAERIAGQGGLSDRGVSVTAA